MPRMFRVMKRGDDGTPVVGSAFAELGVRAGTDITPDRNGLVAPSRADGMSVNPSLNTIPPILLPRRYRPSGTGKASHSVYEYGDGPFVEGPAAHRLRLMPDRATHGTVQPDEVMALAEFQAALAATRVGWREL